MPTAGEEAARRFAETITSGDRPAALAVCHPEIEFESMLGITGGRYVGHDGIDRYFDDVQSAWEDWHVMVERVIEGPDGRVAIVMTMRARGKGSGVSLESRTAHIWTLRDGMLAHNQLFREPHRALEELAAGGSRNPGAGYELEFEDNFDRDSLDDRRWLPYYLPHWSTRELAAARYELGGGCLRLLIEGDQPPWCPGLDGDVRVSSLQTGLFAGPLGRTIGQHRFKPEAVVTEEQQNVRLYTPQHGLFEVRLRALDDPRCMVALWMIGYEDEPSRSAEICVSEIFGRDVGPREARVGMGVHPFGDPDIVDDFAAVPVPIDAHDFHVYAAEWTPEGVSFSVDGERVRTVDQSPAYPMQLMLGIYEFPGEPGATGPATAYPKELVVDYVRGYRAALVS
jgi:ketosteroid isomerase-like protein